MRDVVAEGHRIREQIVKMDIMVVYAAPGHRRELCGEVVAGNRRGCEKRMVGRRRSLRTRASERLAAQRDEHLEGSGELVEGDGLIVLRPSEEEACNPLTCHNAEPTVVGTRCDAACTGWGVVFAGRSPS